MSKIILCIFALSFLLDSCQKKTVEDEKKDSEILTENSFLESESKIEETLEETAIRSFISSLCDEERVAQLFLVSIEGDELYRAVETRSDGQPLVPGGALLFSFNISESAEKIASYTKSVHDFSRSHSLVPPFLAIDQEGGDVNRLRGKTSVLWASKKVAERFSLDGAKQLYAFQAKQLKLLGINMNLAPVAEVLTVQNESFLGARSFGSLSAVLSYGGSFVDSFEENGVATCLKHFPGNGETDPHIGLPKISISENDFDDFVSSFRTLSKKSSAVLMSHAVVSVGEKQETKMPACFSPFWIQTLKEFGFSGLVISDDIFMDALSKNGYPPEKASVEAIRAGVDVIMMSEKKFLHEVKNVISEMKNDAEFSLRVEDAVRRVISFKIKQGILSLLKNDDGTFFVSDGNESIFDEDSFRESYASGLKIYETGGKNEK